MPRPNSQTDERERHDAEGGEHQGVALPAAALEQRRAEAVEGEARRHDLPIASSQSGSTETGKNAPPARLIAKITRPGDRWRRA